MDVCSTASFTKSVLAKRPIRTKIPSDSVRFDSPLARSLRPSPRSFASPATSVVCSFAMTLAFGSLASLFRNIASARSASANS